MVAIKAHTLIHIFSHSSSSCLPAVSHSLHSLWPFFGMSDLIYVSLCVSERLRLCGDFYINLIICTDEWIQCTAYTAYHIYREINQMICVMLLMPMPTKCKRAYTHSSSFTVLYIFLLHYIRNKREREGESTRWRLEAALTLICIAHTPGFMFNVSYMNDTKIYAFCCDKKSVR